MAGLDFHLDVQFANYFIKQLTSSGEVASLDLFILPERILEYRHFQITCKNCEAGFCPPEDGTCLLFALDQFVRWFYLYR